MLNTVQPPYYCAEGTRPIFPFYVIYSSLTDDWRCDQYRWANQLVAPNNTSTVLIHYIGDEKEVVDFPHGNASNQTGRPHIRTCPSVLKSLQEACKHTTTAKAYKSHVTKVPPPTHMPVLQPQNSKQVQNITSKQLQKQRLSHDALYNLHELAVDLPDFVHAICTHPHLVCICINKELLDELDCVLLVQSPSPQLLSYDTTFQLGDFYVSTLAFRHTLFKEAPVIPVAFLIHERKLQACHDELFGICCKLVPALKPIVTDEEQTYVNTPKVTLLKYHLQH